MRVIFGAVMALTASLALGAFTVTANAGPHSGGGGGMGHSDGMGHSGGSSHGPEMGHGSHGMAGNWNGGGRGHGGSGHWRGGRGYGYGYRSGIYIGDAYDDYTECYYRHHRRVCRY